MKRTAKVAIGVFAGLGLLLVALFVMALFALGSYYPDSYEEIDAMENERGISR